MLYAEIYDQFSKATPAEKSEGKKVSKNITVYERVISDNRFKEVYSFDKARSTLQSGCHNSKREKLFMVK